ncbi:MAG TPA: sugar phosphate nucleotidyltransferase [Steroidobacteraceae bacterium]|nr:sugar phosphate nucleotidyltransferase [Steroidobacteraceae bacterium]
MTHLEQHAWAIVLAAGEGSRLRSLTTDATGTTVPKQFCSLQGGPSLLQEALQRAQAVVARERVCAVVADQHRRWWRGALWLLPASNIIVQPRNRGTAIGILLPLMHILARDPLARIVFLPADHYVRDESVLTRALHAALEQLSHRSTELVLLGISPEDADPELGYILPGRSNGYDTAPVERFVEKPDPAAAHRLIEAGGVWNSFIFAAYGSAVLSLVRERAPDIVDDLETALARDAQGPSLAVSDLYEQLPQIDFSRDVLQGAAARLRVLSVPQCGWNDLGTPQRVTRTLRQIQSPHLARPPLATTSTWLNLAAAAEGELQLAG